MKSTLDRPGVCGSLLERVNRQSITRLAKIENGPTCYYHYTCKNSNRCDEFNIHSRNLGRGMKRYQNEENK